MAISFDCSWKQLLGIHARNLSGPPCVTKIVITGCSFHCEESAGFSLNPSWNSLELPRQFTRYKIQILSQTGDVLYAEDVELYEQYFITDNLENLGFFRLSVVFFEYSDGYYASQRDASALYKAIANKPNSLLILEMTQKATYREIDFSTLQGKYTELLQKMKKLKEVEKAHAKCKELLDRCLSRKSNYSNRQNWKILSEFSSEVENHLKIQEKLLTSSKNVYSEFNGIDQMSRQLLIAHERKYKERRALAYSNSERMIDAERLLSSRRRKMFSEMKFFFQDFVVNEGFRLAVNKAYEKEEEMSTGLGYCALILDGLTDILRIKLRFPVKFQGSRSLILWDDRPYPLYLYGKNADINKFEKALACLQHDIFQVPKSYTVFLVPTSDN